MNPITKDTRSNANKQIPFKTAREPHKTIEFRVTKAMEVSGRIMRLRKIEGHKHLTQRYLARKMRKSDVSISKALQGRRMKLLTRIEKFLDKLEFGKRKAA